MVSSSLYPSNRRGGSNQNPAGVMKRASERYAALKQSFDERDQKMNEMTAIRKQARRTTRKHKRTEGEDEMDITEDDSSGGTVEFHKISTSSSPTSPPTTDVEDWPLFSPTSPGEPFLFDSSIVDILGEEVASELGFVQAHDPGAPSEHTVTDFVNDLFAPGVSTSPVFNPPAASICNSGSWPRQRRPADSDSVEARYRARLTAAFGHPNCTLSRPTPALRTPRPSEEFEMRYRARLEALGLNKPRTPTPEEEETNARWEQRKRLNELRKEGFEPWMVQPAASPLNGEIQNICIPEMEDPELLNEILKSMMNENLEDKISPAGMSQGGEAIMTEPDMSDVIEDLLRIIDLPENGAPEQYDGLSSLEDFLSREGLLGEEDLIRILGSDCCHEEESFAEFLTPL